MKHINVLTFHDTINYGGVLQCYALCSTILKNDIEPRIIDLKICDPVKKTSFRHLLKKILTPISNLLESKTRKKRTKYFLSKFKLIETSILYNGDGETFIVGSDQVWNERINGCNSNYLFSNVSDSSKIYSYAASFGIQSTFSEKWNDSLLSCLKRFKKISCRESNGVVKANKLNLEARLDCDPTMLLSENEWRAVESPVKTPNKYILVYIMPGVRKTESSLRRKAKLLAKKNKAKIIYIGNRVYRKFLIFEKNYFDVGPSEFLYLIDNAFEIVTNSYHGFLFSMYFKKKCNVFLTENSFKNGDDRIFTIANGVLNLKIDDSKCNFIDFSNFSNNKNLEKFRSESQAYLEEICYEAKK